MWRRWGPVLELLLESGVTAVFSVVFTPLTVKPAPRGPFIPTNETRSRSLPRQTGALPSQKTGQAGG